jgi:hypothetical protein
MRSIPLQKKVHIFEMNLGNTSLTNLFLYDIECLIDDIEPLNPIFSVSIHENSTTKNSSAKEDYKEYLDYKEAFGFLKFQSKQAIKILGVINGLDLNKSKVKLRIYFTKNNYNEHIVRPTIFHDTITFSKMR